YHSDIRADLSLIPGPQKLKDLFMEHTIRKKLSMADLILTPSKIQEEFLKDFELEKVMTINLGVDTQIFNPSQKNPNFDLILGLKERKYKLLYVGRLSIDKNISLLLEVFQHLDPSLYHLVIAGDGPQRKRVESFSKKLPNLTYLGYIQREEELAQLYASCDIYVSTSFRETYGLSFLEAQACGCILVAFDMGLETQPFKEFLARELTHEAFYKAIIKASRTLSPSLKETISSYIANNFSWASTFKKLIDVYSECTLTKKLRTYRNHQIKAYARK
ncbi:MAG: glycosyltransferase, partial [Caldimicrobium sp.]